MREILGAIMVTSYNYLTTLQGTQIFDKTLNISMRVLLHDCNI